MIANVVTVPLSGSSTNSSSCQAGGRIRFLAAGSTPCRAVAGAGAEQLALFERPQERALGKRCGVLDFDADSATTSMVTGSRSSAVVGHRFGLVPGREVRDVGDRADRLVGPVHVHPGAGADRVGRPGVDGVQQRGVGAVELDQRPRERPVQRLALQRLGLPGPRHHRADAGHRYDLGQGFVGDGVELGGRNVYPAIRPADADDASPAQRGEELAEGRSD